METVGIGSELAGNVIEGQCGKNVKFSVYFCSGVKQKKKKPDSALSKHDSRTREGK